MKVKFRELLIVDEHLIRADEDGQAAVSCWSPLALGGGTTLFGCSSKSTAARGQAAYYLYALHAQDIHKIGSCPNHPLRSRSGSHRILNPPTQQQIIDQPRLPYPCCSRNNHLPAQLQSPSHRLKRMPIKDLDIVHP